MLSVVYKGKPTHHFIKADDDGIMVVNNKKYGESRNIEQVSAEHTFWHM